jgi:hypothetical protein
MYAFENVFIALVSYEVVSRGAGVPQRHHQWKKNHSLSVLSTN